MPRDGRFIEIIGYYDPLVDPPKVVINEDKALTWLRRGAQPSETVQRLLDKAGIIAKFRGQEPSPPAETEPAQSAPPTEGA